MSCLGKQIILGFICEEDTNMRNRLKNWGTMKRQYGQSAQGDQSDRFEGGHIFKIWVRTPHKKDKGKKELKETRTLWNFEKKLFFSLSLQFPIFIITSYLLIQVSMLYLNSILAFTSKTNHLFFIPVFQIPIMSALESSSKNHPPHPQDDSPNPINASSSPQQKLVEIKGTSLDISVTSKKKKEIINIESSQEKQISRSQGGAKEGQRNGSVTMKTIKNKKKLPKCQLCKGTGKKVEMKNCSVCKKFFHLSCLEQNEAKRKYTCDKCRAVQQLPQSKLSKKQKKLQQKLEQENNTIPKYFNNNSTQPSKITQKKLEKEKRKDQSNKTFQKFKQKYPYYISDNNKIKFPIQDKLLLIYRDYFDINQTTLKAYIPTDHPIVPSKYLGNFLELQNFIVSFQGEISKDYFGQYKKSVLYLTMNCDGTDKVFEQLLGAIIKIYMKDIYEKNKTENVKILNDNCFFILLGNLSESENASSEDLAMIAPEIIRHLSIIPSMKEAFRNFQFPEKLTLETKLGVLIKLIQGLSEVDGFHDMVSRKSEKISEMTKDKAEYVSRLKHNEAEALSNKQKLKRIQGQMKQAQKQDKISYSNPSEIDLEGTQNKKKSKESETNKKKSHKLSMQQETSSKIIKEIKERIVEITKNIPFTISEVMFLGTDRNKSHHYFYLREPNRIYLRYHSYMLDESDEYKIFEGKEKIMDYMKLLSSKGINEKHLIQNIAFLIKQQILRNPTEFELQGQMEVEDSGIKDYLGKFIETQEGFRIKIIEEVMEMQDKFSNYLAMKSCRWANESKREEFKLGFPFIDNMQYMKEAIRNLHDNFLFVEIIKETEQRNQSDSNNEDNDKNIMPSEKQSARRKKPIRIWGINSEKIKRFWMEYLETCVDYTGIWITINIFKNYVERYLQKKMESIREMERKENLEREKQQRRILRQIRDKEVQQNRQARQKTRTTRSMQQHRNQDEDNQIEEQLSEGEAPRRSLRSAKNQNPVYRRKPLTIDSDDEVQEKKNNHNKQRKNLDDQQDYIDQEEDSNNEDQCGICKEVGDVICCDTCPKVYHLECLKLREVPEGDWSCIQCLQKLANTRQTRSRAKNLNKKE